MARTPIPKLPQSYPPHLEDVALCYDKKLKENRKL